MDGGIHFDVTADDANFQAKISAIKQGVSDASKQLEAMFSSIKKGARSGELSIEELNKYFDELTLTCEKNGGAIAKLGAKPHARCKSLYCCPELCCCAGYQHRWL